MSDRTACFSVFLLCAVLLTRTGPFARLLWRLAGSPPIHVSSATITPLMVATRASVFMASRMRCSMNHAVRAQTPYLRSISRAETPFLLAHISKTTSTHVRSETFCRGTPFRSAPRTACDKRSIATHAAESLRPSASCGKHRWTAERTMRPRSRGASTSPRHFPSAVPP